MMLILSILCICSLCLAGEKLPLFDIEHAPAPLFTCPVGGGSTDPSIIWNEQTHEWWMFYTQRRANMHFEGPVASVYGSPIGVAVSKNHGITWYYKGALDLPAQDKGSNTFWAPQVFMAEGKYHLVVSYIKGIHNYWGGEKIIKHYKSKDMEDWEFVCNVDGTEGCIDPAVYHLPDGRWKMWYKRDCDGKTCAAYSRDLRHWKSTGKVELDDSNHEGAIVFRWKGKFWLIIDPCNLGYVGLKTFESADCEHWVYNSTILNKSGGRKDDGDQGRHADVLVLGDRAFIFYFTHPGRVYDEKGIEIEENTYQYRRASIQVAELELKDGKIFCDRDKYKEKR